MTPKTTEWYRNLKEQNPHKYEEYLAKAKERNRLRRQRVKEVKKTRNVEEETERQKELARELKMMPKTTEWYRKLKEQNPEKYTEYLAKAKERNRLRRQRVKEVKKTRNVEEEIERQKELARERAKRCYQKKKEASQRSSRSRRGQRETPIPRAKLLQMTPEERKQHRKEIQRRSRAKETPQRKRWRKQKDRQYQKAKRDALKLSFQDHAHRNPKLLV